MSRKNIVRNGVFGMGDCAEAVRAHFAAEGYETQMLTFRRKECRISD